MKVRTWLSLVVVAAGLLAAVILGLWAYMSATPPLHPDPEAIRAVALDTPPREWAGAVREGRQIARAGLSAESLPGVSVAVGAGGAIVWAEGFGWADIDNRTPVTPETRFRIGTASKVLTSAAVGVLLEQGRLNLDETIQTWVPEFPGKPWPVTLRQLMGHLAGVRTDGGDEGPFAEHCEGTLDGLRIFADAPLLFEPGTRFRHSSYGWILVSAAVERAGGEPFLTFMRRNVFEPLGMEDTKADSATEPIPNLATPYFPRFASDPRYGLHLMRDVDYSCYAGASVFVSTPSDLVRFGMAVQEGDLLQPATVELLQTSQRLASGEETGYGLGWDLETLALEAGAARVVGHDGDSLGGMVASLVVLPEQGIVVAVTSNISYAGTRTMASRIARAFAAK